MKKTLKEILALKAENLTVEEKAVVTDNWDLLNDDLRESFKACAPVQTEEALDKEGLKKLIKSSTREDIDATIDEITAGIVKNFNDKFTAARKNAIDTDSKDDKFKENNEIVRSFLRALKSNDVVTLKKLGQKAIDTTQDGSGSDAGFTIPQPLANEVIRIESVGYGIARQIFAYNLLTIGNSKRVTALGSTLSVFWTDEGEKKGASTPSFKIVTLALKKLAVIVPMTDEAIEDSGVDLIALVGQLIREAIDKEVDLQFFMGDGTVWTGIFKDTSIASQAVTGTTGSGIAKLRPEDVISLADNTPLSVNGKYLMSRSVLSSVRTLRENADGTGNYLYNPLGNGGGSTSPFEAGTLNGFPVILAEAAPTSAQATSGGNPIMMFGDFQRGVAYGEKSDVKLKLLDQATITDADGETVLNLAEQDMTALRAVQRVGMKVTLPGAMRRLITV